jgi:hypothetical protein
LTHLGDQPLDISGTSLSDIIIIMRHWTSFNRRHHDWAFNLLNHCWILSTYADAGASMI